MNANQNSVWAIRRPREVVLWLELRCGHRIGIWQLNEWVLSGTEYACPLDCGWQRVRRSQWDPDVPSLIPVPTV